MESRRPADLSAQLGRVVVYVFPRAGNPSRPPPVENWNLIPDARGCTPQSCAFRDHHSELAALGATVFGLSIQSSADQAEIAGRLLLPFSLLSDAGLEFTGAMNLPTFKVAGITLIKRLTMIMRDGVVESVFYPVFPPDKNAEQVIEWLSNNPV